ncbi:MAG: hypothetical protein DDG59_09350 [Anaerolineae bacterium]|jgi:hypothetical protein|nr:MAG: hypothetical protein DDG59_09350 [Anaerolineae bacterium]
MKPDERLTAALQAIARQEVPDTVNLWPQLATHLEQTEMKTMKPTLKIIALLLLVLLTLALVSGAAYALYQYLRGDAGLEAVSQAGLVSEPNITALPTPLPTPTPLPPAARLGQAQTLQQVTLSLDWVYLDDGWQAIGFSVQGLKAYQRLGMPQLDFGELQPEQYRGAGMALLPSETGLQGRYVVYQILRHPETYPAADTFVDLNLTIPLLDGNGNLLDTFRFTAPHLPLHQTPFGGANTYAVRLSGLEMRLEWVVATPQETRLKLCYQQPRPPHLKLKPIVKAQAGQGQESAAVLDGPAVPAQQVIEIAAQVGWRCVEAVFPPLPEQVSAVIVVADGLTDAEGKDLAASPEFVWAELPWQKAIAGIDPLPVQSIGEVKVTLLQAYVDALRAALVYRIEGLTSEPFIDVQLTDLEGKPFFASSGGFSTYENDPSIYIATLTFAKPSGRKADSDFFSQREPILNGRFVGKVTLLLNPWDAQGGQEFTFDLDVPAFPAVTLTPAQSVLSQGLEMRLERLAISPSYTKAYLCYQKPSQADWMLSDQTSLQIGQAQAGLNEFALVYDEDFGMQARPEWASLSGRVRCVEAGFAVGHHSQPETLLLTVNELSQSVPEVIPDDQLQAAKEKLRQQGIEIEWMTFSENGGGGAAPQIKQKPDHLTDMDVMRLFYEALGYTFKGNWAFQVQIQP